jgi:hypothetical protein
MVSGGVSKRRRRGGEEQLRLIPLYGQHQQQSKIEARGVKIGSQQGGQRVGGKGLMMGGQRPMRLQCAAAAAATAQLLLLLLLLLLLTVAAALLWKLALLDSVIGCYLVG